MWEEHGRCNAPRNDAGPASATLTAHRPPSSTPVFGLGRRGIHGHLIKGGLDVGDQSVGLLEIERAIAFPTVCSEPNLRGESPLRRFGIFENDMARARPRLFRASDHVSLAGLCAAFTIWLSMVVVSGGALGCFAIFILWTIDATTGWRIRIAPRLSTEAVSDRVAWLTFSLGVWAMLWIVLTAALGESDGDYRKWDEIRRQVRMFRTAGFIAAAVPTFVTTWQFLDRRNSKRNVPGGRELGRAEKDSPLGI